MNIRKYTTRRNLTAYASALAMCAGLAVSAASAQTGQERDPYQDRDRQKQIDQHRKDHRAMMNGDMSFISLSELDGAKVTNATADDIGTVDDMIIERGTDRVTHVIVNSGAWLGLGGKDVAVPFNSFGWDHQADDPTLTLSMTQEQLRDRPEFSKDEWLGTGFKDDTLRRELTGADRPMSDPYEGCLDHGETQIKGVVVAIDRRASMIDDQGYNPHIDNRDRDPERHRDMHDDRDRQRSNPNDPATRDRDPNQPTTRDRDWSDRDTMRDTTRTYRGYDNDEVVLTVRTEQGETKKVVLGPSWHVLGSDAAPVRGDTVTILAYNVSPDTKAQQPGQRQDPALRQPQGEKIYVARSIQTNGRQATLRDQEGKPAWMKDRYTQQDMRARYLLFSDLNGKSVQCRGQSCGEVADVIIESNSGRVAFLSVDPDENFLGIADTHRLIPSNVVSVTKDHVIVDASKEMILASRQAPEDRNYDSLTESDVRSVYSAFDVECPEFKHHKRSTGDWSQETRERYEEQNKDRDRR